MGRLSHNWVEPMPPVSDPDAVPSPKPSYWPGDFAYRQLVEDNEGVATASITLESWAIFRDGLEADEGPAALNAFQTDSSQAWSSRTEASEARDDSDSAKKPAACVEKLLRIQGRPYYIGSGLQEHDIDLPIWGYVVFRTAGYGAHEEAKWQQGKRVSNELIDAEFKSEIDRRALGATDVAQKFQCHWVEGKEWQGASIEQMAKYYRDMDLADRCGFDHQLFLCIDDASLESLATAAPARLRHFCWTPMPYVIAVARSAGMKTTEDEIEEDKEDEEDGMELDVAPDSFNVTVQSLTGRLFEFTANQTLDFREMAVGYGPEDL